MRRLIVTNQAGLACGGILVTRALRLLGSVRDVIEIFAVSGFTGVTGGGIDKNVIAWSREGKLVAVAVAISDVGAKCGAMRAVVIH